MYTKHKWESDRYFNFGYVKYLPKDFDENQKYPLVLFLHGAGERGDDLDLASCHGFMKHVREEGKEYPISEAYMHMLEETIGRHPDYWLWSHNRWKRTRKMLEQRLEEQEKRKEERIKMALSQKDGGVNE